MATTDKMVTLIDKPVYRTVSIVLLALTATGTAYYLFIGHWFEALGLSAVLAIGLGFVLARDRLPTLFPLLFIIAGLVNALGYTLGLWVEHTPFDESVHAFTSFTGCAAAGWLLLRRTRWLEGDEPVRLTLAVMAIGAVLGVLWEGFEWLIGIIDGPRDILIDLIMDLIGAFAAGLFVAWVARARSRSPQAQARDRRSAG